VHTCGVCDYGRSPLPTTLRHCRSLSGFGPMIADMAVPSCPMGARTVHCDVPRPPPPSPRRRGGGGYAGPRRISAQLCRRSQCELASCSVSQFAARTRMQVSVRSAGGGAPRLARRGTRCVWQYPVGNCRSNVPPGSWPPGGDGAGGRGRAEGACRGGDTRRAPRRATPGDPEFSCPHHERGLTSRAEWWSATRPGHGRGAQHREAQARPGHRHGRGHSAHSGGRCAGPPRREGDRHLP
jgi:hypothetical protein